MPRPKGSKDGPRPANAPPRGRPRKHPKDASKSISPPQERIETSTETIDCDADDEYGFDFEFTEEGLDEMLRIETDASINVTCRNPNTILHADIAPLETSQLGTNVTKKPGLQIPTNAGLTSDQHPAPTSESCSGTPSNPTSTSQSPSAPQVNSKDVLSSLREAAVHSQRRPFFTPRQPNTFEAESSDESDGMESQNDDDFVPSKSPGPASTNKLAPTIKAWFKRPKRMPEWLYSYFINTIGPLIFAKDGARLAPPSTYSDVSRASSFWVRPSEPTFLLSRHRFDPTLFYRPRIFLWLPHFFVDELKCPKCHILLEKNGALTPRRVTDLEDNFYIVSWAYYCRKGCQTMYHGWSRRLIDSLPRFLRLAFPAVLSHNGGLSNRVVTQLRMCNQHKMGPAGVRSLLIELHTLRFSNMQAQYLEAVFELERGQQSDARYEQSSLHSHFGHELTSFGDFWDKDKFAGFVPSKSYLCNVLNHVIESQEQDAVQHTSCLPLDQLAIDDSHKVNKHMAKYDGVPVFNALWTCMTSRYIRGQVLTLTKAHDERIGPLTEIAQSAKRYGHSPPPVVFSDDPVKDKKLIYSAFPSLAENLTPRAAASGLKALTLPEDVQVTILSNADLCEKSLSCLMLPLDLDDDASLCISFDAEWNMSRRLGVSIIQIASHSDPKNIYIIPVHKFSNLPPSLLRLLISNRVFKIGVSVQADLTRLKKQFTQLSQQVNFNIIDLKEFCIDRGIISRKDSGSLEQLTEKAIGMYITKDDTIRRCEEWEAKILSAEHRTYAALDVFTSRLIFEAASAVKPALRVNSETPGGTRVTLLVQEGGAVVAYGSVAFDQPSTFNHVRVKTRKNHRLVIDVDILLNPSAAAILHLIRGEGSTRTKAGALTLGQLQAASSESSTFKVVVPVSLLDFDTHNNNKQNKTVTSEPISAPSSSSHSVQSTSLQDQKELDSDNEDVVAEPPEEEDDVLVSLKMLEACSAVEDKSSASERKGKRRATTLASEVVAVNDIASTLQKLIEKPPDVGEVMTRIKKDIFHAFHMIPTSVNHGVRPAFLRALRDHMMRWDPEIRASVDRTCQRVFKCSFDDMLVRNPRFICERTPRHIPSPSVLVPAIKHVFDTFGNALDSKTQLPLFNHTARKKAEAVLDLARQGYLSDLDDIPMYEKSGIDNYGLETFRSLRGTNNVEGGPHSDIYRKFGALHDEVDGAMSYCDWINGDLYEKSQEQFGVCLFPEALRVRLGMEPYNEHTAEKFRGIKTNSNDDWLRRRQGLALPALPPTTPAARRYFFSKIRDFAVLACDNGKSRIDFELFAREWNQSADGKDRFYITADVLGAYAKSWEKISNVRASEELISDGMDLIAETRSTFSAPDFPFPSFLTNTSMSSNLAPSQAVIEFDSPPPQSLSVELPLSRARLPPPQAEHHTLSTMTIYPSTTSLSLNTVTAPAPPPIEPHCVVDSISRTSSVDSDQRPAKRRRREIPVEERKRATIRSCRRCHEATCPGNNNVLNCPVACTVASREISHNSEQFSPQMARPKGSKDGPRPANAPPRGRPKKPKLNASKSLKNITSNQVSEKNVYESDADDEYGFDGEEFSAEALEEIFQIETRELVNAQISSPGASIPGNEATAPTQPPSPSIAATSDSTSSGPSKPTLSMFRETVKRSQYRPFFTARSCVVNEESGSEDNDSDSSDSMDSENEADFSPPKPDKLCAPPTKAWFKKPRKMPEWLYRYFGETISPLIHAKDGNRLLQPKIFSQHQEVSPSFWIHPPEPAVLLAHRHFNPVLYYRPRVFLWLPHFLVQELRCPLCGKPLEKNGALTPRRITDMEDNFYIVAWAYYCRKGCQKMFHGWSHRLRDSLPRYLRLAFPAILSHNGGVSHNVINQLRVGNQHKMGPAGVRSLLVEMHTLRFNKRQLQYLESAFEIERGEQLNGHDIQLNLHTHFGYRFPPFGDFSDQEMYAGFVPSKHYLGDMMNKAIESCEHDATQHTSCLPLDQIAIDDSHKAI
ncbi:hypothetical protein H0H93_006013 [Arthromyces matolae]|nr:hypothetical protein H0H93_006013 [Arthromyces matolae]